MFRILGKLPTHWLNTNAEAKFVFRVKLVNWDPEACFAVLIQFY